MALDRDVQPSFGRLFGCILILASISSTLYTGPHKEAEYMFSPNDIWLLFTIPFFVIM